MIVSEVPFEICISYLKRGVGIGLDYSEAETCAWPEPKHC